MDVNVLPVDEFSPPEECGDERCRDYFMEFVYCVIIPGGIFLLVTFLLSIFILSTCCKRKQETEDEEFQMECYNTIRRASQSLRDLSHKRDTLIEPRSGSLSLPRNGSHASRGRQGCYSAPNTLQRERRRQHREDTFSRTPPSYQTPPDYSSLFTRSLGQACESEPLAASSPVNYNRYSMS